MATSNHLSVLRPFAIDHAPVSSELPIGTRLAVNSLYFDTMLSLIPPKYYLRPEGGDDDDDAADSKYFKVNRQLEIGVTCSMISRNLDPPRLALKRNTHDTMYRCRIRKEPRRVLERSKRTQRKPRSFVSLKVRIPQLLRCRRDIAPTGLLAAPLHSS